MVVVTGTRFWSCRSWRTQWSKWASLSLPIVASDSLAPLLRYHFHHNIYELVRLTWIAYD